MTSKKKLVTSWTKRVKTLRADCQRAIERLAADVYRDVVAPTCRVHGIKFRSGMGRYSFYIPADGKIFFERAEPISDIEDAKWIIDRARDAHADNGDRGSNEEQKLENLRDST